MCVGARRRPRRKTQVCATSVPDIAREGRGSLNPIWLRWLHPFLESLQWEVLERLLNTRDGAFVKSGLSFKSRRWLQ